MSAMQHANMWPKEEKQQLNVLNLAFSFSFSVSNQFIASKKGSFSAEKKLPEIKKLPETMKVAPKLPSILWTALAS